MKSILLLLIFTCIGIYSRAQVINKYLASGTAKVNSRDYQEAIPDLDKAIEADSTNAHTYYLRATAKIYVQRTADAITDLSYAIRLDSTKADYYYMRGYLGDISNRDRALYDFNKAISLDPNFAKAYKGRAVIWFSRQAYQAALTDLDKSIALDNKDAETYYSRAMNRMKLKQDTTAACDDFNMSKKLGSRNAQDQINMYCK